MTQAVCTKVLFLDIDGVLNKLNTQEGIKETTTRLDGQQMVTIYTGVDKKIVNKFLGWLKDKEDLDVVLSSDWRKHDRFMEILNEHGIYWEGTTEIIGRRGLEIWEYLSKRPWYKHIAILDDNQHMNPVARYFVQTSEFHGVQDKHLRKVNKLLGYDQA